ncbi:MAG TPA: DUF6065 family protein [Stellaceae bacterium]|jgi:hypothetical protein|nr:DUF6065 family protein [Stellaceae bacterium]
MEEPAEPICRFYRLIPDAPEPRRADKGADGNVTIDAVRYCVPLTTASSFGCHICPPMDFRLLLDDDQTFWGYSGLPPDEWISIQGGIQYPGFRDHFRDVAPDGIGDLAPPFIEQGSEPGQVVIWTGLMMTTAPGWSVCVRGIVNAKNTQAYQAYEGILETSKRDEPLFANIRLKRSNSPIYFVKTTPFFQIQPILRESYLNQSFDVRDTDALTPSDWQRFAERFQRKADHLRRPGAMYAAETRRLLREESATP